MAEDASVEVEDTDDMDLEEAFENEMEVGYCIVFAGESSVNWKLETLM